VRSGSAQGQNCRREDREDFANLTLSAIFLHLFNPIGKTSRTRSSDRQTVMSFPNRNALRRTSSLDPDPQALCQEKSCPGKPNGWIVRMVRVVVGPLQRTKVGGFGWGCPELVWLFMMARERQATTTGNAPGLASSPKTPGADF
jgi:hypothetical protein